MVSSDRDQRVVGDVGQPLGAGGHPREVGVTRQVAAVRELLKPVPLDVPPVGQVEADLVCQLQWGGNSLSSHCTPDNRAFD